MIAQGSSKGINDQKYYITISFYGVSNDSTLSDSIYSFQYSSNDWEMYSILLNLPKGSKRLKYSFNRTRYYHGTEPFLFDEISLYTVPEYYQIMIAEDIDFNSIVAQDTVIGKDSLVLNIQDYNKILFWKVRTICVSGAGPWSDTWTFRTKSPQPDIPDLYAPVNSDNLQKADIEFMWLGVDFAEDYVLQLSKSDDFSQLEFEESNITDTILKSKLGRKSSKRQDYR